MARSSLNAVADSSADVLELLAAEQPLLGSAQRDERHVVGTAVAEAPADALKHADDLERLTVDRQPGSDKGADFGFEILWNVGTQYDHPAPRLVLPFREEASGCQIVAEHVVVVGRRAGHPDVGVVVAELELAAALDFRHDRIDVGRVGREGECVVDFERGLIPGHAPCQEAGRVDRQDVGAQRSDLLVDPLLRAGAGRKHRDHGADADDDAEHRENRPEQVRLDRLQSDPHDLAEQHLGSHLS